jgi:hypothetical protein
VVKFKILEAKTKSLTLTHNSGSFTEAKKELYQKGLKAYFKFLRCFEHHKPKIKTLLHVLFKVKYFTFIHPKIVYNFSNISIPGSFIF